LDEGLSYEFVESGLILAIQSLADLYNISVKKGDFAHHGEAYEFVSAYLEEREGIPTPALLSEKFNIDQKAAGMDIEYARAEFSKGVKFRGIAAAINENRSGLQTDPDKFLPVMQQQLADIERNLDDDVQIYDNGSLERLESYRERKRLRNTGLKIIGVPTPFSSINATGLGWLEGNLISAFARPGIGKSWMCCKIAAVAASRGFRTLLISTEMPKAEMDLRMDVVLGNMLKFKLSHRALKRGDPIDEDEYNFYHTTAATEKLFFVDHIENEGLSPESIGNMVKKYKPVFVVIDGSYLLDADTRRSAQWEKNDDIYKALKRMCIVQKLAMFTTTQANRNSARIFSPPKAEDVAYGDALLRNSDIVFSMCRIEDEPDTILTHWQKFRDTEIPLEYLKMTWDVDSGNIRQKNDSE